MQQDCENGVSTQQIWETLVKSLAREFEKVEIAGIIQRTDGRIRIVVLFAGDFTNVCVSGIVLPEGAEIFHTHPFDLPYPSIMDFLAMGSLGSGTFWIFSPSGAVQMVHILQEDGTRLIAMRLFGPSDFPFGPDGCAVEIINMLDTNQEGTHPPSSD